MDACRRDEWRRRLLSFLAWSWKGLEGTGTKVRGKLTVRLGLEPEKLVKLELKMVAREKLEGKSQRTCMCMSSMKGGQSGKRLHTTHFYQKWQN